MTREKAYEAAYALKDIHDFEFFMDKIAGVYDNTDGNINEFYHNELVPLMEKELAHRVSILEEM